MLVLLLLMLPAVLLLSFSSILHQSTVRLYPEPASSAPACAKIFVSPVCFTLSHYHRNERKIGALSHTNEANNVLVGVEHWEPFAAFFSIYFILFYIFFVRLFQDIFTPHAAVVWRWCVWCAKQRKAVKKGHKEDEAKSKHRKSDFGEDEVDARWCLFTVLYLTKRRCRLRCPLIKMLLSWHVLQRHQQNKTKRKRMMALTTRPV